MAGFLFDKNTMFDIIPDRSQDLVDQLNSVMRFAIYFTIIIFALKRDIRAIYFTIFVAFITWIIYKQYAAEDSDKRELFNRLGIKEDFKSRNCVKPSKNNPFMNVSRVDYADFPNRPKACSIKDSAKETSEFFEKGLNRKEDDVFFKSASDRQFFTMPFTTIPNDQTGFAKWLYNIGPTCKEKTVACQ